MAMFKGNLVLFNARARKRLTLRKLAVASGIPAVALAGMERGEPLPDDLRPRLPRLARVLGVKVEELATVTVISTGTEVENGRP
jgi:transcriptional regulator with XRE-family HTH domain